MKKLVFFFIILLLTFTECVNFKRKNFYKSSYSGPLSVFLSDCKEYLGMHVIREIHDYGGGQVSYIVSNFNSEKCKKSKGYIRTEIYLDLKIDENLENLLEKTDVSINTSVSKDDNAIGTVESNNKKLAREYNKDINADDGTETNPRCTGILRADKVPVIISSSQACQQKYANIFIQLITFFEHLNQEEVDNFVNNNLTFQIRYFPDEKNLKTYFCENENDQNDESCVSVVFRKK